jgi:hypothetical protein
MDLFIKLFGGLLSSVYHCFDRIVIHGYLTGLSRPEHVAHFFQQVVGSPAGRHLTSSALQCCTRLVNQLRTKNLETSSINKSLEYTRAAQRAPKRS